MHPAFPKRSLPTILFAVLVIGLAWLLARALALSTIVQHNTRLAELASRGEPWFAWTLRQPEDIIGPYARGWRTSPTGGLVNQTEQPVISLPLHGRALDTRLFRLLQLQYSADQPWQIRVHFAASPSAPEYYSTSIDLPATEDATKQIDLRALQWQSVPGATKPGNQNKLWGNPQQKATTLLLYFQPTQQATAPGSLRVRQILLPWSETGTELTLKQRTVTCPGPGTSPEDIRGNGLASYSPLRPCLLPEQSLWLEKAIRQQGRGLFFPEEGRSIAPVTGHLLAMVLFLFAAFGIQRLCQLPTRPLWPWAVSGLLTANYFWPWLGQPEGHWLPGLVKILGAGFAGIILIWAIINDIRQIKRAMVTSFLYILSIGSISLLASSTMLHFNQADFHWTPFWQYLLWAVFQQSIIGPMLAERLTQHCHLSQWQSALLAGVVFGLLHFPNPSLMVITTIGGSFWAWLWLKFRLLLPLAVSHALLALGLFGFADSWWLTSGRVGLDFLGF